MLPPSKPLSEMHSTMENDTSDAPFPGSSLGGQMHEDTITVKANDASDQEATTSSIRDGVVFSI